MTLTDFSRIRIIEHLAQHRWNNLPQYPVFILKPAASLFFSALRDRNNEIVGVKVDIGPPFNAMNSLPSRWNVTLISVSETIE